MIVEVGKKNIRAHCKLCAGNKTLSCARNTTLNFKKYLDNGTRLALASYARVCNYFLVVLYKFVTLELLNN